MRSVKTVVQAGVQDPVWGRVRDRVLTPVWEQVRDRVGDRVKNHA